MPTYTFSCLNKKCRNKTFDIFSTIKSYDGSGICPRCKEKSTTRDYVQDLPVAQVVKGDSELSLGDLAQRNSNRFSDDYKDHLYQKHNSYKNQDEDGVELPAGMTKVKRPKNKNPFGSGKKRRTITKRGNNG